MTRETRRVAVLGGTFDPVHNGHLAIATAARAELEAVEGWMVAASVPNLRDAPVASARDRLDMLNAAIGDDSGLRVIDIELRRDGVSYTIDTLDELSRAHPSLELWWVLGSDAARHIHAWHRSAELLERGRFAVVQRPATAPLQASELTALGMDPRRTRLLGFTPPPIDATTVRRRVAEGAVIADLVPAAVAALILERGLYTR